MKYVLHICLTGMLLQLNNLMKQLNNMSKIFIILIVEEVIDVFHSGDYKVECHYLILKSSKPIGHCLLNGEFHNIKELKNGG
jgi:hypothetical protein